MSSGHASRDLIQTYNLPSKEPATVTNNYSTPSINTMCESAKPRCGKETEGIEKFNVVWSLKREYSRQRLKALLKNTISFSNSKPTFVWVLNV